MIKLNLFSWQLSLRVLLLCVLSIAFGLVLWETDWLFTQVVIITLLLITLFDIHRMVHRTNHDVLRFLNALKYADYDVSFSEKKEPKRYQELLNELDQIKKQYAKENHTATLREKHFTQLLSNLKSGYLVLNKRSNSIQFSTPLFFEYLAISVASEKQGIENKFPGLLKQIQQMNSGEQLLLKNADYNYAFKTDLVLHIQHYELDGQELIALELTAASNNEQHNESDFDAWISFGKVISHEILNGITPIHSSAQALQLIGKGIGEDDIALKMKKGLDLIEKQCVYMEAFSDKYRQLYQLPAPEFKIEKWETTLRHSINLHAAELKEKSIKVILEGESLNQPYHGDPGQLQQVFTNLLLNSIRALDSKQEKQIKISVNGNNTHYLIHFEDNGAGIPKEILSRIFVPFFTTKENGSGIGLGITKQILWKHKASIHYVSQPKEGTCFLIRFPRR